MLFWLLILRRLLATGHHPEGERDIERIESPTNCWWRAVSCKAPKVAGGRAPIMAEWGVDSNAAGRSGGT